jgi:Fuc2NAc and GlcNAc transferase
VVSGKHVYEAHRTHAYQQLARRWGSHAAVTKAVLLINCLWLLPLATLAAIKPAFAAWIAVVALMPVTAMVLRVSSGKDDNGGPDDP